MDKVYTVYRTENLINEKFYIGIHKTVDPNDDYLGSGRWLKASINKHGRQNFVKSILLVTPDSAEAFLAEKQLVDEARKHPNCMNIREGGAGGFDYINKSGIAIESKRINGVLAVRKIHQRYRDDPEFRERLRIMWQENFPRYLASETPEQKAARIKKAALARVGMIFPEDRCKRLSETHKGNLNSQYGTVWITNGESTKKIPLESLGNFTSLGWQKGRKIKPVKEKRVREPYVCGTTRSYNHGCKCQLCKSAVAKYMREYFIKNGRKYY